VIVELGSRRFGPKEVELISLMVTVMLFEAAHDFGAYADTHEDFRVPYVDGDVHTSLVVFAVA
jgi:hypothetical protein